MQDLFRTSFEIHKLQHKIDHHSRLLFVGSCFSENISAMLESYKFSVLSNPFGIIYNPVSLAEEFRMIVSKHVFTEKDIFLEEGIFRSFYMHSRMSHPDRAAMLELMNDTVERGNNFLQKATHLILTPGTATVHTLKATGKIVANNHKQPAHLFAKRQLEFHEVFEAYDVLIEELQSFKPDLKIIFTVSPVRHLKDGAIQNMRSKATLIAAVHEVIKKKKGVFYFPAYELMMDDLRDYRFYAKDMLHPNSVAVAYIFDKFKNACIDENEFELMKEIDDLKTAMHHKPFFPESDQHIEFRKKYFLKVQQLQAKYAHVDFEEELNFFNAAI